MSRRRTLRLLSSSQLCAISSRMEGGANVLSEAIVAGVPVLVSRIAGNVGILGDNYPGLFPAGDTREVTKLMLRAESDRKFLGKLQHDVRRLAPLCNPKREQDAWSRLLAKLPTRA
jgi:glycosyltransferase involved in cell wall biosynthesis